MDNNKKKQKREGNKEVNNFCNYSLVAFNNKN